MDPTVCDPLQKALIEQHFGEQVSNAPPELLIHLAQRFKSLGNTAVRRKQFQGQRFVTAFIISRHAGDSIEGSTSSVSIEAVKCYSQAIAAAEHDETLYANRSVAYLALYQYQAALQDATKAVQLHQSWPKGYYRLGMAHMAMGDWDAAAAALSQGLHLDPSNDQMEAKLVESKKLLAEERQASLATSALLKRDLVLKLRQVRREEVRQRMLKQFKQSMAAPAWELEDYEWRPTFLPAMKQKRLDKAKVLADPTARMLAEYVHALADLAQPKGCIPLLQDQSRLDAFQTAIESALRELPGGHVIVLGNGSNILGLMASQLGARQVTCIERGPMLYRVAKQTLQSNRHMKGTDSICLIDRQLQACGIKGGLTPTDIATAVSQAQAAHNAAMAAMHAHSFAAIEASTDTQGTAAAAAAAAAVKTPVDSATAAGRHLAAEAAAGVAAADAGGGLAADAADEAVSDKAAGQQACSPKNQSPHHADQKVDQMGLGWHPSKTQGQEEEVQNPFPLPRIAEMQLGVKAETEQAQQKAEEEKMPAQQVEDGDRSIPALGLEEEYTTALDQAHGTTHFGVGQDRQHTTKTTCKALLQQQLHRIRQSAVVLSEPAEVLVTDLIDHSVLGKGLLPSLDYAAERLITPGARVVPAAIQVWGMLVEMRIDSISGFDLLALNGFRWHPHHDRVDLSRVPHKRLSSPFPVLALDLQQRVDAIAGAGLTNTSLPKTDFMWESDTQLRIHATSDGLWNGVAFWFEVQTHGTSVVSSWAGGRPGLPICSSWGQAVQYLDYKRVRKGHSVKLRVQQDSNQILFSSVPAQQRPRHAYIPRWHFDMVQDHMRNDAYDQAISRAVDFKKALGCEGVGVLDMGAGSGLLSMMAARAGAEWVVGAEVSQAMCDAGAETVVMNGYGAKCIMVNKDVRHLETSAKPDGTPPEMQSKADIAIFEVFDSGLIGEGVLHMLAAAKQKLLTKEAILVPAAATVFCQPLQMRIGQASMKDSNNNEMSLE
ncbi:TPA: hypothetical protein ACH3X1_003982 [Trebouxia sp. C0004]